MVTLSPPKVCYQSFVRKLTRTVLSGYQVNSTTGGSAGSQSLDYAYRLFFVDPSSKTTGTLDQTFTFSPTSRQATYAGTSIMIPASTIKWSIDINTSIPFTDGLLFSYVVSGLSASPQSNVSYTTTISNSTIYYLPLGSSASLVAQVEVFNYAVVDGDQQVAIDHSVSISPEAAWVLHLGFPPFNRSLYYDPVVGLATLVSKSGSGGSGSDLGLIVGTAVGVSAAVCIVMTALIIIVAAAWYTARTKRRFEPGPAVNFSGADV